MRMMKIIVNNQDEFESLIDTATELGRWSFDKEILNKEFHSPEDGIEVKEAEMHIQYLKSILDKYRKEVALIND